MAKQFEPVTNPASGSQQVRRFGALVRQRRKALGMHQNELALATGLGRRYIIELEAGKPSCHMGKALLVAEAVGLRIFDLMTAGPADNALLPDLPDPGPAPAPTLPPDLPEDTDEPTR